MKVLLVAILACFANALADDHMDSDSPAVLPGTLYAFMDHFNNEDTEAINEMTEFPFSSSEEQTSLSRMRSL